MKVYMTVNDNKKQYYLMVTMIMITVMMMIVIVINEMTIRLPYEENDCINKREY